jgi:hypothetical protein
MFAEVYNVHRLTKEKITPKKIAQIYREKVLGINCKTYFDHYYSRLRDYYSPREEKAVKIILRHLAFNEELTRGTCYQLFLEGSGLDSDADKFNRLMTDLENDFYISFDSENHQYKFGSKLLRDWWLRHYGMEAT